MNFSCNVDANISMFNWSCFFFCSFPLLVWTSSNPFHPHPNDPAFTTRRRSAQQCSAVPPKSSPCSHVWVFLRRRLWCNKLKRPFPSAENHIIARYWLKMGPNVCLRNRKRLFCWRQSGLVVFIFLEVECIISHMWDTLVQHQRI